MTSCACCNRCWMINANIRSWLLFVVVIGSLVILLSGCAVSQGLTPEEERGHEIYSHGTSPSGQAITVQFGQDGPQLPASSAPCASCHGRDGRGRSEGGVTAPDLRWLQLSRETPAGSGTVRSRPAYTDRSLTRAFTMGLDSGGTTLNPVMPRYHFPDSDARELIAYLKTLGVKPEPGISDTSVRVGAILPPKGSTSPGMVRAVREVLTAYFEEAAQHEQIFGRRIELEILELPGDPAQTGTAVHEFVRDRHIFALVVAFMTGFEVEVVSVLDDMGVPLVMGVTPFPPPATDRYAFFLDGGIPSQAEALANYAIATHVGSPPKVVLLYLSGGVEQHIADDIFEQFRTAGWTAVQQVALGRDSDLVKLRESHPDIVMILSRDISQKELAAWPKTMFLVPGVFLTADAIASPMPTGSRIFATFPLLPADFAGPGLAEYWGLTKKYQLHSGDLQAQLAALSGAKVLLEILRRSGRDLSREKLAEIEEGLQGFQTGWTPPFSFSPNQHIGIPNPRVVEVDPKSQSFVQVQ